MSIIKNWFNSQGLIVSLDREVNDLKLEVSSLQKELSERDTKIETLEEALRSNQKVDKIYVTVDTEGNPIEPYTVKSLADMTLRINGKGYHKVEWCDRGYCSGRVTYTVSGPRKDLSSIMDVQVIFKDGQLIEVCFTRPQITCPAHVETSYKVDTIDALRAALHRYLGTGVTVELYELKSTTKATTKA